MRELRSRELIAEMVLVMEASLAQVVQMIVEAVLLHQEVEVAEEAVAEAQPQRKPYQQIRVVELLLQQ